VSTEAARAAATAAGAARCTCGVSDRNRSVSAFRTGITAFRRFGQEPRGPPLHEFGRFRADGRFEAPPGRTARRLRATRIIRVLDRLSGSSLTAVRPPRPPQDPPGAQAGPQRPPATRTFPPPPSPPPRHPPPADSDGLHFYDPDPGPARARGDSDPEASRSPWRLEYQAASPDQVRRVPQIMVKYWSNTRRNGQNGQLPARSREWSNNGRAPVAWCAEHVPARACQQAKI
jgi:hypothetical protein